MVAGIVVQLRLPCARAGLFQRHGHSAGQRAGTIALRRRLHVNPLITPPGTMELEWSHAFSASGAYSIPTTLKYTPEGTHTYWGRTEFSASFDSLSSVEQNEDRVTHFGDRVTLAANCVVLDGEKLDLAIAPVASVLLRGDDGARIGATGIARYDVGQNSGGITLTWTGATAPSPTNPAGTFDLGGGFGRRLRSGGFLGRFTVYGNGLLEKSTGFDRQVSLFEGFEYQLSGNVAIDVTGQHLNINGVVDHQAMIGLTVNFGRL